MLDPSMRNEFQLVVLIFTGVLLLLGAVFTSIGVLRSRMTRGWMRTQGQVVSKSGSTWGMASQYPTFRWMAPDGREYSKTSMVRSSLGPRPGTLVPVLFDPRDPSRGMIDSFVQRGTIFSVIGGILLTCGAGLAVVSLVIAFG